MGNVASTPRLSDVSPSLPDPSRAIHTDGVLTSVVWDNAPSTTLGKTIAQGKRTLGILLDGGTGDPTALTVVADPTLSAWDEVRVHVGATISPVARERLNKLISGFTTDGRPKVGTDWRTKGVEVLLASGRVNAPVAINGARMPSGGWAWAASKPIRAATKTRPSVARRAARMPAPATVVAPKPKVVEPKVEPPVVAPVVTSTLKPANDPGIFTHPKPFTFHVWQHDDVKAGLDDVLAVHRQMKPRTSTVTLLTGPTGTGKTLAAENLAATHGLPYLKVDAAGMVTFSDWVGSMTLDESDKGIVTRFASSQFLEAIRADGPYAGQIRVVLIDEINRVSGTSAANALLPILDGSGTIYVPDARRTFHVDRAVLFIVTANIGSQYAGTVELDSALVNRILATLDVDYPPTVDEVRVVVQQSGCTVAQAELLVRVAQQTRTLSSNRTISAPGVSTRQLVGAGRFCAKGTPILRAARMAFVNTYKAEGGASSERAAVLAAAEAILRGAQV